MQRQTLPGEKQFTASILVLTKELPKRILLLHHKKYDKWVQPGGHVEKFENPIECAIREAKEESGLDIHFLLKEVHLIDSVAYALPIPIFFFEEKIAPYKEEPEHFHLDIFYKVEVPFQEVKNAEKEAHDIGWFTLEEAEKLPMFDNTKFVIQKIFQK